MGNTYYKPFININQNMIEKATTPIRPAYTHDIVWYSNEVQNMLDK